MIQEADSQQIKLPDRKEITLCEAVTALVYGNAYNFVDYMLDGGPETEQHKVKARDLIERLHRAAYAGSVQLRGLGNGDDHVSGHKPIDSLYFSEPRGLRWDSDQIWNYDLSPDRPKYISRPPNFRMDYHDVHLDREGFETLLRKMGVSVMQSPDADVTGDQKIYKTGLAGRPTSINFVLPMARDRLNAGDYPETQTKFSEQLAEDFAKVHPCAPRVKPKTIRNNPAFRELWRRRTPPKNIDPS